MVLAWRRKVRWPLWLVACTIGILPAVDPKYEPILNGRYLAPVLPILLIWTALSMSGVCRWWSAAIASPWLSPERPRRWVVPCVATIALLLCLSLPIAQQASLFRNYDDVRENYRTGDRILQVVETARRLGPSAQPVVLDARLEKMALGPGAGMLRPVLETALGVAGVRTEVTWLGKDRPPGVREGQLVVLASRQKPQFTQDAVNQLGLRSASGGPARPHSQASLYGVNRFGRPS
ncbi:MAG: hypothetical protein U0821_23835 [Chloroflexota bacterium]